MADQTDLKKSKPIARFPRLPKGEDVSELAKGTWTPPTFKATDIDGTTTFTFSVPTRDRLRSLDKDIYRSLFESGGSAWTAALETVFLTARSSKTKTVAEHIDTLLYTVFRKALKLLMDDAKALGAKYDEQRRTDFNAIIDEESEAFLSTSRRPTGRKRLHSIDHRRPKRLFTRYSTLLPLMAQLRAFVDERKGSGILDESAIRTEVGSMFKEHSWINHVLNRCAFIELPSDVMGTAVVESSICGEWDAPQLAVGIIRCEESTGRRGRPLNVKTVIKLLDQGKLLLDASSIEHR
jgi:hypothetical protein